MSYLKSATREYFKRELSMVYNGEKRELEAEAKNILKDKIKDIVKNSGLKQLSNSKAQEYDSKGIVYHILKVVLPSYYGKTYEDLLVFNLDVPDAEKVMDVFKVIYDDLSLVSMIINSANK